MWPKRISEVTKGDIEEVVANRRAEGLEVEFKKELSDGKEGPKARDAIARELVAFANGYGGTLILGMDEDDGAGRRARGVVALADSKALAKRLEDAVADVIDPPLQGFECEAVVMDEMTGAGVVVMRVPASFVGPHWVKKERAGGVCYSRSSTRTVPVSMREIHDLVIGRERRKDRIAEVRDDALARAKRARSDYLAVPARDAPPGPKPYFGLDVVAVPVPQIRCELDRRTEGHTSVRVPAMRGGREAPLVFPYGGSDWRPMLRGLRQSSQSASNATYFETGTSGHIVYSFTYMGKGTAALPVADNTGSNFGIYRDWIAAFHLGVLRRLEKFRRAAGVPNANYKIFCALSNVGKWTIKDDQTIIGYSEYFFPDEAWMPEIDVGETTTFGAILNQLEDDLMNLGGYEKGPSVELDWSSLLSS